VFTGEGRFDESSWDGKGPGGVVAGAGALERRTVVFAGSVTQGARARGAGERHCELIAISDPREPIQRALAGTERNLERRVEQWVRARLCG
jgi:glycerate kinase